MEHEEGASMIPAGSSLLAKVRAAAGTVTTPLFEFIAAIMVLPLMLIAATLELVVDPNR